MARPQCDTPLVFILYKCHWFVSQIFSSQLGPAVSRGPPYDSFAKEATIERHSPSPPPRFLVPTPPILEATAPPAAIIMTGGWVGGCLISRLVGSEYHQPWP
jgi:hypothetical protein